MKKEAKTNPVSVFNLLADLIDKNNFIESKGGVGRNIIHQFMMHDVHNYGKPYPLSKFYPCFWLLAFAHTREIPGLPKLKILLKEHMQNGRLGEVDPSDNTLSVALSRTSKGELDFPNIARILAHEMGHLLTEIVYGSFTPPEDSWGVGIGTAFRMGLMSPFAQFSEEKQTLPFFIYTKQGFGGFEYKEEQYANEFIAEVIAYCIVHGELPFEKFLLPKDRAQIKIGIDSFLQKCSDYLNTLIQDSHLEQVMPWLSTWSSSNVFANIPEDQQNFFENFLLTGSLWTAAFITKDIEMVGRIFTTTFSFYNPPAFFAFPSGLFASLPSSEFKTEVEKLLAPYQAPSAPPPSDSSLSAPYSPDSISDWNPSESYSLSDNPPSMNPGYYDDQPSISESTGLEYLSAPSGTAPTNPAYQDENDLSAHPIPQTGEYSSSLFPRKIGKKTPSEEEQFFYSSTLS